MASRGSVIPLFCGQIKAGKPMTITDPEMTRFMMSLNDAVDLVLFAFANGKSGDTFVQKAPAATIRQLAEALNTIFNAKNEIRVIGTRHGEKKHETLLNREELINAEDIKDYYRVPSDTRDLNYGKYFEEGEAKLSLEHDYTSGNTRQLKQSELIEMLLKLDYIQHELAGKTQTAEAGF